MADGKHRLPFLYHDLPIPIYRAILIVGAIHESPAQKRTLQRAIRESPLHLRFSQRLDKPKFVLQKECQPLDNLLRKII